MIIIGVVGYCENACVAVAQSTCNSLRGATGCVDLGSPDRPDSRLRILRRVVNDGLAYGKKALILTRIIFKAEADFLRQYGAVLFHVPGRMSEEIRMLASDLFVSDEEYTAPYVFSASEAVSELMIQPRAPIQQRRR